MNNQGLAANVSYEVELSGWFDWMRREISLGGIDLPNEETSVLFAATAMQLASRLRATYRHPPDSLERAFIRSAIIFQCWKRQKEIKAESQWHGIVSKLRSVDAVKILRTIGKTGRSHVVLANDGLQYVITLSSGFEDTTPATELICNEMARALGLCVPDVAAVFLRTKLAAGAHLAWQSGRVNVHSPEVCCGFRYLDSPPSEGSSATPRNLRHLIGGLVFDIWTLNLAPRHLFANFNSVTGRTESVLLDHSHCLMGSDWGDFLKCTHETLAGPQGIAAKVHRWEQLEPWLLRVGNLDMNAIWELAFQMPPSWYGNRRQVLANVLDKLGERFWDLRRSVAHYLQRGYFVNMKLPPRPSQDSSGSNVQPGHSLISA